MTEVNSIRWAVGDRCIISKSGKEAVIRLIRGSMVSVDLGYGHSRPWIHIDDIVPAELDDKNTDTI